MNDKFQPVLVRALTLVLFMTKGDMAKIMTERFFCLLSFQTMTELTISVGRPVSFRLVPCLASPFTSFYLGKPVTPGDCIQQPTQLSLDRPAGIPSSSSAYPPAGSLDSFDYYSRPCFSACIRGRFPPLFPWSEEHERDHAHFRNGSRRDRATEYEAVIPARRRRCINCPQHPVRIAPISSHSGHEVVCKYCRSSRALPCPGRRQQRSVAQLEIPYIWFSIFHNILCVWVTSLIVDPFESFQDGHKITLSVSQSFIKF